MPLIYAFFSCFFLFFTPLFADELDLWRAYELAVENDAGHLASKAEKRASDTHKAQGLSGLLPDLSVRGSFTHSDSDRYDKYETRSYNISLRQPLFNLEAYHQYKRSSLSTDAGDFLFESAFSDMRQRLIFAYFGFLSSKDRELLLDSEKDALAKQLEQIEAMRSRGLATLADVHEARSRYLDVGSRIVEAQSLSETRRAELERILGIRVDKIRGLYPDLVYEAPDLPLKDWQERALEGNFHIKHYENRAETEKASLNMALSRYAPSVDFFMQYMDTNESTHYRGAEDTIASVGVQLYFPIYRGGGDYARHKEAKANYEKAVFQLEAVRREVVHKLTESYMNLQGAHARIISLEEAVKANEISLDSGKKGVSAGIRTLSDVLNAEERLYDSKTRLLQAKYDHILARISILYHSGLLKAEDMKNINNMLYTQ